MLALPAAPVAGTHFPTETQVEWHWGEVEGATGYRFNTVDDYSTSEDLNTETTKTETGLTCNTSYTRFVWAYNACVSLPVILTQATNACSFSCGSLTINHVEGNVAPVSKTVTYGTIYNIPGEPSKCWITSNLGADHQATAVNDVTEASAGWYWQFNRKQGYKQDGSTVTPSRNTTSIDENSDWLVTNDPCTTELGTGWRIPTRTEWENVDASGSWNNWNGPWSSGLKLHANF